MVDAGKADHLNSPDHDEQHFKLNLRKQGMGDIGGHDQHLPGFYRLHLAADGDFRLAVQHMHDRVIRRGVLGKPLPLVK